MNILKEIEKAQSAARARRGSPLEYLPDAALKVWKTTGLPPELSLLPPDQISAYARMIGVNLDKEVEVT